jgi:protein gp37
MGVETAIGWTDHTFNPWWGCVRVSPGCNHCYAETFAKRTGNDVWGKSADRRRFGDKHWNEPVKWNRKAEQDGVRRRVFCASMADVFEDRADHEEDRERLWELIEATPHLDWQLLTKRPENVLDMVPADWLGGVEEWSGWPGNVWIGTTVEDQQRADERIPFLVNIPAPVRFLSCEPLLDSVWLGEALGYERGRSGYRDLDGYWHEEEPDGWDPQIDWVIVGGESGPKHRPLDLDWARFLREQCDAAGVPFFFKQVGGRTPKAGGDLLDGEQIVAFPSPGNGSRERRADPSQNGRSEA